MPDIPADLVAPILEQLFDQNGGNYYHLAQTALASKTWCYEAQRIMYANFTAHSVLQHTKFLETLGMNQSGNLFRLVHSYQLILDEAEAIFPTLTPLHRLAAALADALPRMINLASLAIDIGSFTWVVSEVIIKRPMSHLSLVSLSYAILMKDDAYTVKHILRDQNNVQHLSLKILQDDNVFLSLIQKTLTEIRLPNTLHTLAGDTAVFDTIAMTSLMSLKTLQWIQTGDTRDDIFLTDREPSIIPKVVQHLGSLEKLFIQDANTVSSDVEYSDPPSGKFTFRSILAHYPTNSSLQTLKLGQYTGFKSVALLSHNLFPNIHTLILGECNEPSTSARQIIDSAFERLPSLQTVITRSLRSTSSWYMYHRYGVDGEIGIPVGEEWSAL